MFKIGDTVVYETMGVCRIKDIRTEQFPGLESMQYYVLELVFGPRTTIYAPVDNEKLNIRHIMTAKEVDELILNLPSDQTDWVENDTQRKEEYGAILKRGDRTEIAGLIKTLYAKREQQISSGRKFHMADAKIMGEAERVLYEELAVILDISPADVVGYIADRLNDSEQDNV